MFTIKKPKPKIKKNQKPNVHYQKLNNHDENTPNFSQFCAVKIMVTYLYQLDFQLLVLQLEGLLFLLVNFEEEELLATIVTVNSRCQQIVEQNEVFC